MNIDLKDPNVARELKDNPKRHVAVVGLMNSNNRILLIRTNRFPDHWQPIGGGMDPEDQSPVETLIRELKEEANVSISDDLFQFEITTEYDFGEGEVHFYTAKLNGETQIKFDESEIKDWQWISIDDALTLQMFPATRKFLNYLISK